MLLTEVVEDWCWHLGFFWWTEGTIGTLSEQAFKPLWGWSKEFLQPPAVKEVFIEETHWSLWVFRGWPHMRGV
jgi:hypothetical protein